MGARLVHVLGELSVDGVEVRARLDRKARLLLRLLAMARGRSVAVDALVDALWPDRPPARPADQVAVLVSRLRRELGREAVEHGDQGYRLGSVATDLDELATVLAEAERRQQAGETSVAAARIALSLVGGRLPEPVCEADWVLADQAAAARLVRRARHVAAEALLEAGAWPEALELASADRLADAYDETAVRAVMRAQVLAGRPALALAAYAELSGTLAEELGTDPAPETSAVHTAILRGEMSSLRPAGVTRRLVGRTSQAGHLDALVTRTRAGQVRIAVVTGEAGIGKTTLLRAWSEARTSAGDIVLGGTCGPLDRSAPLDVVLSAIGEHLRRTGDRERLLGEDAAILGPLVGVGAHREPAAAGPADPVLGPATLYAAVTAVLARIAGDHGVILVVDDAHLAGPALADWLQFALRRPFPMLVVAAVRPAEGTTLPGTDRVGLGPLDLAATAELVGASRAEELYARSRGHPLFLTELAEAPGDELPPSLVAAVVRRCEELGDAADLVRAAAVLGTGLDVDVLASVVSRPPLDVLAGIELAAERGLLVERAGRYAFRHELVREAVAAGTSPSRASLLHRRAGEALDRRMGADPVVVAEHARLGGDDVLAARALRRAADRASARFDHATAEHLLDQSLDLDPDVGTRLARARVRIRLAHYPEAEADAEGAGAVGAEVAAWAAYFDRRFDEAVRHADDGALAIQDDAGRARCLMVAGRTRHARGDLTEAERQLRTALDLASGPDLLTARAWLGVLMAHRSQVDAAIDLLRPATRPGIGVDHTSAALHALLFTGHAHALAGRPSAALAAFDRYTSEVARRHVPRFGGRGINFSGWVLRNVGEAAAAVDAHQEALELAGGAGTIEVRVAALEDLAEDRLGADDPDAAEGFLDQAEAALAGDDLVFGWRLAMKLRLLRARSALATGRAAEALATSRALQEVATRAGVPRYASVAALVGHQARATLGQPVDLDRAWADLAAVERSVRLEAWWWAGETGRALGQARWLDRAVALVDDLGRASGVHRVALQAEADRRLAAWSAKPH